MCTDTMYSPLLCSFLSFAHACTDTHTQTHKHSHSRTHTHTLHWWSFLGWESTTQTRGRKAGSSFSSFSHTHTHFIPAQHRHKLWSGCDNIIPPLRPHWGESIPNQRDRLPEPRPPSVTLPLPLLLIPQSRLRLTSPGPDERERGREGESEGLEGGEGER